MCTLAWRQAGGTLWACFNRDEQRSRAPAEAPAVRVVDGRAAVYARDPDGGGSWFAAAAAGFAVALLNHYPPGRPAPDRGARSRGKLVVQLAHRAGIADALAALQAAALDDYAPFCLFGLSPETVWARAWDGRQLAQLDWETPFWTTSSYRPEAVAAWRRSWWREHFSGGDAACMAELMRRIHPDDPASGIAMDRVDARTLSQIELEIGPAGLHFSYREREPHGAGFRAPVSLSLPA